MSQVCSAPHSIVLYLYFVFRCCVQIGQNPWSSTIRGYTSTFPGIARYDCGNAFPNAASWNGFSTWSTANAPSAWSTRSYARDASTRSSNDANASSSTRQRPTSSNETAWHVVYFYPRRSSIFHEQLLKFHIVDVFEIIRVFVFYFEKIFLFL